MEGNAQVQCTMREYVWAEAYRLYMEAGAKMVNFAPVHPDHETAVGVANATVKAFDDTFPSLESVANAANAGGGFDAG